MRVWIQRKGTSYQEINLRSESMVPKFLVLRTHPMGPACSNNESAIIAILTTEELWLSVERGNQCDPTIIKIMIHHY